MNKINFQNGSSGKTPLNKTNMNLIQDNVENEFKKLINALSNNKETVTGETLNIKDSAEERIYEININGNSKQETRSGKNKFKLPESATSNGITYTNNEDGTFNINGTSTEQATFKIVVPLEGSGFTVGESYVISSNQSIGDVRYYVHSCTASGTWVKTQLDFLNETAKVKTFKETDAEYISCNIVVPSGITINLTNVKIQIEEGTTATEHEAYGVSPSPYYPSEIKSCGDNINIFIDNGLKTTDANYKIQTYNIPTQQPFRAIGDVKDTFVKVNNEWYEKHHIKEMVLDGTETISAYAYGTNSYLIANIKDIIYDTKKLITRCTHFYVVSYSDRTIEKDNILYVDYASGNNLIFRNSTFSSVDEFKAFLTSQYEARTPIYVDYILTTPTLIKCTEEQSTILWDIEQNAKTYKNVTNIYSEDEVVPNVAITYKKDIETLFANTLVESGV